jgi:four helix bundle protein
MATFKKFEEITVWRKSRELTKLVYEATKREKFARDFALRDQIRRASVSIMSNIAEGFERSGTAEFSQFLATAKGSAGEVRAQLYVALDQGYLEHDFFEKLTFLATEVSRMTSGLMKYLRASGLKGTKFKKSNERLET